MPTAKLRLAKTQQIPLPLGFGLKNKTPGGWQAVGGFSFIPWTIRKERMEQYTVFDIALKEILAGWIPLKIAALLVAVVVAYRLPEIVTALKG
jgi:hypothetical protein